MQQSISPLTPKETAWMNEAVAAARSLVKAHSPTDRAAPFEPAALDRAYIKWWRGGERGDANEVINAFGAALGQQPALPCAWGGRYLQRRLVLSTSLTQGGQR